MDNQKTPKTPENQSTQPENPPIGTFAERQLLWGGVEFHDEVPEYLHNQRFDEELPRAARRLNFE